MIEKIDEIVDMLEKKNKQRLTACNSISRWICAGMWGFWTQNEACGVRHNQN